MKVVQINATCGSGSTGKICVSLGKLLTEAGIENYIMYTQGTSDYPNGIRYSGGVYKKLQALKSKLLGNYGFNSRIATRRLIGHLDKIRPDIVHIHNIHGHDCDLDMLLKYLNKNGIKVFWTFHDCWAFTGYCTHFDMIGCDKWTKECKDCPQHREYSWFLDNSNKLYHEKKKLISALDLTVITPSVWLAELVGSSFLSDKSVKVINNGIDLTVFKPTESDFREKHSLLDKYIILGVAFGWNNKKGLDVFLELAKRLDERYSIVLVGADGDLPVLSDNIISVSRTRDQAELAGIYSTADILVNPTREDTYPTVNMESLACGTPVLTFRTGGSPEILDDSCGCVVDKDDIDALENEIYRICEEGVFERSDCIEKSASFDMNDRFKEYIDLYRSFE